MFLIFSLSKPVLLQTALFVPMITVLNAKIHTICMIMQVAFWIARVIKDFIL